MDPNNRGGYSGPVSSVEALSQNAAGCNPDPYASAQGMTESDWITVASGVALFIPGADTADVLANVAERELVVAGEQATLHGAERLAQAGFDEASVAATKSGQVLQQADGGTVYLNEVSPGRYDFIIEGSRGVITAHRGWSYKSVARLAGNYGWQGWP